MSAQQLLIELLISGFFAIACLRARAESPSKIAFAPRSLFALTDRLERIKRSRWQWFAMVLLLVVVRMQVGKPLVAEITALAMFALFLAMPTAKGVFPAGRRHA